MTQTARQLLLRQIADMQALHAQALTRHGNGATARAYEDFITRLFRRLEANR